MSSTNSTPKPLPEDQRAELARLLRERKQQLHRFPLSSAQQRLWFLDQLSPGNTSYVVPVYYRLRGTLDTAALGAALDGIVRRHDVLRTRFIGAEGAGAQIVSPTGNAPLEITDLAGLPAEERERRIEALITAELERPFDLTSGPLFRARLFVVDAEESRLLLTMHHIISDGWSIGVLVREMAALYTAALQKGPEPLPPLPIQYADFAVWQSRKLREGGLEAQAAYWSRQLANPPSELALPADKPRPAVWAPRGAALTFELPEALTPRVQALAQEEGLTPFMLFLAAFQALLSRYTGQEDIWVGSPIANRNRKELEGLIGFFVNSLVMRGDLSGDPTARELFRRTRRVALDAYAHQDYPFEKLVEELSPERGLGLHPLFQVMFAVQNAPYEGLNLPRLALEQLLLPITSTRFDLEMHLWDDRGRFKGILFYSAERFLRETATRIIGHFVTLLEGMVREPDRRLSTFSLVTPSERAALQRWNETSRPFPSDRSLASLFEEQVRRAPEAVALRCAGTTLTYAELNRRANRLARWLRLQGVRPDDTVGLRLERGVELVVALVAIIKGGGAYVPLDPDLPPERLRTVLEDARVRLVLDSATVVPEDLDSADLPDVVSPDNLAYIVFTSGSTGRPKGVGVSHRSIVRLVKETDYVQLGPDDCVLQGSTVSFDAATFEIWGPLLNGGRLVIVQKDELLTPTRLRATLREERVTAMFLTTAVFNQFARESVDLFAGIPNVLFGGEAADTSLVRRVLQHAAPGRLLHVYGPTETTTYATWAWLREVPPEGSLLPIGQPLANTEAWLLDARMQPVPPGVPGELYLGGPGVARGYVGRPDLTAERFVPHPLGPPGSRLYRTGDICRRRADGALEFLGRRDHQIKVRGHRIELGEVEAVLRSCPAVSDAVVLLREDLPGGPGLVAYAAPAAEATASTTAGTDQRVSEWRMVFEERIYGQERERPVGFDTIGWNSSYTGDPLPAGQMREWLDDTVSRVASLRARRVLELGCGTGMILLAPEVRCERYVGTDISPGVLDTLRGQVDALGLSGVTLLCRSASDFSGLEPRAFDAVVLNSVVQYFPDLGYLREVIEGAIDRLADGGSLFLGDLRSHSLLEAFHASVQLFRAAPDEPARQVRARVEQAIDGERELFVDPAFFAALARRHPRVRSVRIRLKRGPSRNELTAFRYAAILEIGERQSAPASPPTLDWATRKLTLSTLRGLIQAEQPERVLVTNVPNRRVWREVRLAEALAIPGSRSTRELLESHAEDGVEPAHLRASLEELGYEVEIGWSPARDRVDVALRRSGAAPVPLPIEVLDESARAWETFGNDPLRAWKDLRRMGQIREHLARSLPDYMIPARIQVLPSLPLTAVGKVDRMRLAAMELPGHGGDRAFTPPRTATESTLATLWADLLAIDRVGVGDDFFALGGHSLLATQLVVRVRERFGVELPLRSLFEDPTLEGLAARIDRERGSAPLPTIAPASRTGSLPLSFAQQRLWFLDQLSPGNPFYNVSWSIALDGRLDHEALRAALREIVRRHESLRTVLRASDGEPVQVILETVDVPLPIHDLRGHTPEQRRQEARRLAMEEAHRPFELSRGPVFRASLTRLDEESHVLTLAMHHIVSDGWSIGVFNRELAALYRAFRLGRPSPLPELPIQYADFAVWQRAHLEGERLKPHLDYWRSRLDGVPALELPTDRPRPSVQTYRGATLVLSLGSELSQALESLTQARGSTLYMALLAAFQTLLHRYTGQQDIAVGSPIANRSRQELEGLIGFFVNSLVMRGDLSGDPRFTDLLERTREAALGAFAHQDLPFERLVQELQPDRELSRNPLFQVMFAVQNAPSVAPDLEGLTLRPLTDLPATTRFDLELHVWKAEQDLRCMLVYSTDLFDEPTMRRFAGHYRTLLEGIVAAPERRLSELPLLSDDERAELVLWNETRRSQPELPDIGALFAEQARATPEALAVEYGAKRLTYRELHQRAERLARHLIQLGVRPDEPVALLLDRSEQLITAMVAVVRAGAAYLPIDPSNPPAHSTFLLRDTEARLVLTEAAHAASAAALVEALAPAYPTVVRVDAELPEPPALPLPPGDPDRLAYVTYTSGSTGRPKGVAVTHRGVVRLVRNAGTLQIQVGERVAQLANVAFDAATFEVWGSLLNGGAVVGISREQVLSPQELSSALRELRIQSMFVTSALFSQVVREEPEAFASVERLLVGGEAMDPRWARECLQRGAPRRFFNAYGPTETTTFATLQEVSEVPEGVGSIPIGRPIANTTAHVLDEHLRPVPTGVPGELYLGGPGLARCYWRRPELTAERMIPDPTGSTPGARLYRTGDLVRRRADGSLDFLRRLDAQVKIRGHRIEPGEVEALLTESPQVAQAAVVVRDDLPGGRGLAAYVVARDEASPAHEASEGTGSTVRDHVDAWSMVFDDRIYGSGEPAAEVGFDLSGWRSSYTGEPIPAEQMREWLDDTLTTLRSRQPSRILELGCGTGMLLLGLARECQSYVGTDISSVVLGRLGSQVQALGLGGKVRLARRSADDFTGLEPRAFDAVLLNSVVQYFPSVDYLVDVVEKAVERLADGGFLFLGDLRSHPLMGVFHQSVQLHRAADDTPADVLQARARRAAEEDEELYVDPALFATLATRLPRVRGVRIRLQRGHAHSELTRFRYSAILEVGAASSGQEPRPVRWLDWGTEVRTTEALQRLLSSNGSETVGLLRVPNARLASLVAVAHRLDGEDPSLTAADLRPLKDDTAVDPTWLQEQGEARGWRVDVAWSAGDAEGRMDVLLTQGLGPAELPRLPVEHSARPSASTASFANHPMRARRDKALVARLKQELSARLPDYMVPRHLAVLERMPLTPQGKLDRRALPAPDGERRQVSRDFVAPRTPLERTIARIFEEVLGVERIGARDDFFLLGGHSLLATQVVSRLREAVGLQLRLQTLFEHSVVERLAQAVENLRWVTDTTTPPPSSADYESGEL
ncbi:non-ribosomal peptide synthetase [Hyalangium gracile]|uniref:non-ribosomal peptide synthetase n=1 Tax=Hyalangium gracile TaxID=394092 RepID=UPI001CCD1530|nr:non-ribosomal peptide synthetase [Hyalangium gracile]